MLGLLKKKVQKNALVAVCPSTDGIALARVRRDRESTPILELCEAHDSQNISIQGAEIARLAKRHHLGRQQCVTILELGAYSLLLVDAPEVQPEEMQAAVRWRVKDLIDFNIDDAVIDVFEVPNQKTSAAQKMYVVASRSDVVRRQVELLNEAGLNLNVVDIPEMAMRNVAALLPEDVGGMALLYLGNSGGVITITRQATLYLSRRIDIGLDHFDSEHQERINQQLDNIVVELQRSMDYYESHFSQPSLSSIVIAPTARPIPGIEQYIQSQLGVHCRSLDTNVLIDNSVSMDQETQARCFLALGAALREEAESQ